MMSDSTGSEPGWESVTTQSSSFEPGILKGKSLKGKALRAFPLQRFPLRDGEIKSKWECKCGIVRVQKGTGFTNLVQLVDISHPNWVTLTDRAHASVQIAAFRSLLYPKKVLEGHAWIELMVGAVRRLPPSTQSTRAHQVPSTDWIELCDSS